MLLNNHQNNCNITKSFQSVGTALYMLHSCPLRKGSYLLKTWRYYIPFIGFKEKPNIATMFFLLNYLSARISAGVNDPTPCRTDTWFRIYTRFCFPLSSLNLNTDSYQTTLPCSHTFIVTLSISDFQTIWSDNGQLIVVISDSLFWDCVDAEL